MASTFMNSFDLLGDDESVDVSVLYACMKKKAVLEVPSSPPKARKEITVYGEEPEKLEYEDDEPNCEQTGSNGNGNLVKNGTTNEKDNDNDGWLAVPKKTYVQQGQGNGYEQRYYRNGGQSYGGWRRGRGNYHGVQHTNNGNSGVNGDNKLGDGERPRRNRNWNEGGNRRGRGNGGHRGRGRGGAEYRRIDNGGVKESDINGDAAVSHYNAASEGDSGVTFESSNGKEAEVKKTDQEVTNGEEAGVKKTGEEVNNGKEAGQKKTGEEVNGDVAEPEETPEERKKREIAEQNKKEREERRRKRAEEEAEEARKMTLDQYEKLILKKKQALNLQKEEASRRVVAAAEDLENMKLVGKKQDIDDILIVGKEKPKVKAVLDKPKNSEEKLKKSDSLDKKGHKPVAVSVAKLFERASFGGSHGAERGRHGGNQSGLVRRFPYRGDSAGSNGAVEFPTEKDFPVLGSVAHKPVTVPSEPLAVAEEPAPSESSRSASGSTDKSAASSSRSGSRGNRPRTGNSGSNRGATTRPASERSDSVKAEH